MRISCAHKGLAHIEVEELFPEVTWKADNLALVDCDLEYLEHVLEFIGSVRLVFEPMGETPSTDIESVLEAVDKIDFKYLEGVPMRVKVFKIGVVDVDWKSEALERAAGSKIFSKLENPKIDLKHPEEVVAIVVWSGGIAVSRFVREIKASTITKRAPKNLPNSKGGAMKQTIAKLMVNSHRMKPGDYVLDPFCGHGGLLYEMVEAGYTPIGIELDSRIVGQAVENMNYLGYRNRIHLIHGDALSPPLRRGVIEYVVTDPPYALQTTTSGRTVEEIILQWLGTFTDKVVISMATPNESLKELPDRWITLKTSTDYVHKGLTRRMRLITNG